MSEADAVQTIERKTRRKGSDVRNDILTSATHLFAERGFAAVTTRDISEAANVPMSGIYRHFRDKRALYSECMVTAYTRVTSRTFAPVEQDLDPLTFLYRITRNLCETHGENADVPKLVLRQLLERDIETFTQLSNAVTLEPTRKIVRRIGELNVQGREESIVHSIYSMTFGFAHMAPQIDYFGMDLAHLQTPEGMAVHILSLLCPEYDWGDIAGIAIA